MRCFVPASYADAIRKSVGSEKGLPKNMIPSGSGLCPKSPKTLLLYIFTFVRRHQSASMI
jgi:hypothetical protein